MVLTTMIFAKDVEGMTAFYRDGFGLSVQREESMEGYTVLVGDGIRLSLHAIPDHIASRITIAEPPEPRSDTPIKLLFGVGDVDATTSGLEHLGAQLFETTTDDVWDATDPEGNVIQIRPR